MPSVGTSLKPVKRMPAPKTLPKIEATRLHARSRPLARRTACATRSDPAGEAMPTRFAKALAGRYISLAVRKAVAAHAPDL